MDPNCLGFKKINTATFGDSVPSCIPSLISSAVNDKHNGLKQKDNKDSSSDCDLEENEAIVDSDVSFRMASLSIRQFNNSKKGDEILRSSQANFGTLDTQV